ncbi:MAG TPA: sigma-70 family RNA polymerase sigma factor [Planctomycetaceae bacterium]
MFRAFARRLVDGDDEAARELLARYAARLVALARRRIGPRLAAKADPEDVLQSVLRTFFRRLNAGEVELRGWGSLWGFLSLMTLRKCQHHEARYAAACRDVRAEVSLSLNDASGEPFAFLIPDREPTPDEVAAFADEVAALLAVLDERDRRVVELLLDGEPTEAVADRVGCSERTVQRTAARLCRRLAARPGDHGGPGPNGIPNGRLSPGDAESVFVYGGGPKPEAPRGGNDGDAAQAPL